MKIKKIECNVWERKNDNNRVSAVELNQVVVHFDVNPDDKFKLSVNCFSLTNEIGEELPCDDGHGKCLMPITINMPVLYLCFKMDGYHLDNGSTFCINVKDPDTHINEEHSFILKNDIWEEQS